MLKLDVYVRSNVKDFIIAFKEVEKNLKSNNVLGRESKEVAYDMMNIIKKKFIERSRWLPRKNRLVPSIFVQKAGRYGFRVASNYPGLAPAEFGTRPHFQPNNPIFGGPQREFIIGGPMAGHTREKMHPGARGLFAITDTWNDFITSPILQEKGLKLLDDVARPFFDIPNR